MLSVGHPSDTDRKSMNGTPMACPHVADAAALGLGQNPSMDACNSVGEFMKFCSQKPLVGNGVVYGCHERFMQDVPKLLRFRAWTKG